MYISQGEIEVDTGPRTTSIIGLTMLLAATAVIFIVALLISIVKL